MPGRNPTGTAPARTLLLELRGQAGGGRLQGKEVSPKKQARGRDSGVRKARPDRPGSETASSVLPTFGGERVQGVALNAKRRGKVQTGTCCQWEKGGAKSATRRRADGAVATRCERGGNHPSAGEPKRPG